jgi:hypothetical protein
MKKLFILFFLAAQAIPAFAQTEVEGNQYGTWSSANSPYLVIGDITVPAGQVLTIEAGVEVDFQGHYKIHVSGDLQAPGTESDSIFFTSANQATGWGGITFETPALSSLAYCRMEYGKTDANAQYPEMHGGAVRLLSSDAVFSNCMFTNNSALPSQGMGGAVYGINTSETSFIHCKFYKNTGYSEGGAIKFTSDFYGEITDCEFIENSTSYGGGAIMLYSVVDTKITNCLFANNYTNFSNGGAVESLGFGLNTISFANCTMVGNSANHGSGGAGAFYFAQVDFVNCIVYNNHSAYDDDNVYIDAGSSSATVNYCNITMPEYNTTGNNNIEADPLFVDANNGDFHLQEGSPCIDAGTDIGLPFMGLAPDMGCYEFYDATFVNHFNTKSIAIFPNPTSGHFKVLDHQSPVTKIIVQDISGKMVQIISDGINDVSSLSSGIYFLKIETEKEIYWSSIIKN